MQVLLGIALLMLIVIAVIAVTVVAISAIRRGRTRSSGSLGNAMQELEGLFVESKKHVLKSERAEEAEERERSGDPPEK